MDATTSAVPSTTVPAPRTVLTAAIVTAAGTAGVAAAALAGWAPVFARIVSNHNETLLRGTGD